MAKKRRLRDGELTDEEAAEWFESVVQIGNCYYSKTSEYLRWWTALQAELKTKAAEKDYARVGDEAF
jgi:hypothetical protein